MVDASGQPRLRPWVPVVGGLLVVGLVGGIVAIPVVLRHLASQIALPQREEEEKPRVASRLGQEFAKSAGSYQVAPPPPPAIPVAEKVAHTSAPPVQKASILPDFNFWSGHGPTAPPAPSPSPAPAPPTLPQSSAAPATTPPAPKEPKYRKWDYQARGKAETSPVPQAAPERKELADVGKASQLITVPPVAIPAYPLVTIYRSQTLVGRLTQAVNSDIPGQVVIELVLPVFDKFGYDHLIWDKGTKIIASQEGKPQYGNTRLPLKLEQVELLTGEVVSFKAMIGDQEGANGVAGKVNNHYGKLVAGTLLSAILNIGVRTATGTPTGYYQNPAQEAARDIGQDVQSSAKGVIDRELKRPPTIEIAAGTNVTINLGENITFSRKPIVIK